MIINLKQSFKSIERRAAGLVRKNASFPAKMITWPRQARDKHMERALKKETRFCRAPVRRWQLWLLWRWQFWSETLSDYQDRLGTTNRTKKFESDSASALSFLRMDPSRMRLCPLTAALSTTCWGRQSMRRIHCTPRCAENASIFSAILCWKTIFLPRQAWDKHKETYLSFAPILCWKMIFLPRQARDENGESTQKKRCVF
eukprot:COSAG06_NODE_16713_length_985_cov_1.215576_1_plen_201_part_00